MFRADRSPGGCYRLSDGSFGHVRETGFDPSDCLDVHCEDARSDMAAVDVGAFGLVQRVEPRRIKENALEVQGEGPRAPVALPEDECDVLAEGR